MARQPFEPTTTLQPGPKGAATQARLPHLALVDNGALLPVKHLPAMVVDTAIGFGRFRLLPGRRQLLIDGQPVAMGSRAFDVLLALVLQRQRVVSQGELMQAVWPGLVVESNTLQVHVSALRKLLGNGAVSTVSRRGYRFTGQVDGDCVAVTHAAQPDPVAVAGPYADADLSRGLSVYLFNGLEIHPGASLVVVKGRIEILRPLVMALLMALVDRRLRPVGKLELMRVVWPGKAMTENNLQVHVAALRKVLGPSAIATIPGQGYLFNGHPPEPVAAPLLAAGGGRSRSGPAVTGMTPRPGSSPSERAALSLLARAIQLTALHELATADLGPPGDSALHSETVGQVDQSTCAHAAAAMGFSALANDPTGLGDALVQLGARLVTFGKREQALSCLLAAASLWSSAESPSGR